ncbi:MAG: hypothetical protein ACLFM0_10420, partial [Spirochaetales bacterium]
ELNDLRLRGASLANPQAIPETISQTYQLRFSGIDVSGTEFDGLVSDLNELRHLELFNANGATSEDMRNLGVEDVALLNYFATTGSDLEDLTFLPEGTNYGILRAESSNLQSLEGLDKIDSFKELLLAFNSDLGGEENLNLLLGFTSAERIDLRGTGFSEDEIATLEAEFPNTDIDF